MRSLPPVSCQVREALAVAVLWIPGLAPGLLLPARGCSCQIEVDLRSRLPIALMTYKKEIIMETLLIMITLFIILDIASLRWGFDSTDGTDSPEWLHRQERGGII